MSVTLFITGIVLLVLAALLAMHATRNELRRGRASYTWLQVLLVVLLVLVGVLLLCFNWGVVSGPDVPKRATGSRPPAGTAGNYTEETRRKYFVDFNVITTERCVTLIHKYFPSGSPLPAGATSDTTAFFMPADLGRKQEGSYPDAINVPLRPPVLEAEQATTCLDPVQAAMNMNGFGLAQIGGTTLAALNPWMQPIQGDPATVISGWVQRCLTNDDVIRHDCAKTMAATAELIGKFSASGVVQATSLWNYHCKYACSVTGNAVPVLELNPDREYRASFLVVSLGLGANDCVVRFGWNVGSQGIDGGDQRLAGLPCVPLGTLETRQGAAPPLRT